MRLEIVDADVRVVHLSTRIPFRFGKAELATSPYLFVRVDVTMDAVRASGISADFLAPEWFMKSTAASWAADLSVLTDIVDGAVQTALVVGPQPSVFELWRRIYEAQLARAARDGWSVLAAGFGVSVVERAVIDAYCRAARTTFGEALRQNTFGIQLDELHPELAGVSPSVLIPREPLRSIIVRHTVGLADPLDGGEAGSEDDGLPQTLGDAIEAYGLTYFKIKVAGEATADRERLERVLEIVARNCGQEYRFTVDANEGFGSAEEFREFWSEVHASFSPDVRRRLLFVEQPLRRDVALGDETERVFNTWTGRPPLIIDESDEDTDSVPRALACGYAGASVKSCKGIFREIGNACLLELRRSGDPSTQYIVSGEDFSTLGPVSLPQNLALMANLGLTHTELNGHHYYRGLSMFSRAVQENTTTNHADLYRWHEDVFATLRIERGTVRLESVLAAPFGAVSVLDLSRLETYPLDSLRRHVDAAS